VQAPFHVASAGRVGTEREVGPCALGTRTDRRACAVVPAGVPCDAFAAARVMRRCWKPKQHVGTSHVRSRCCARACTHSAHGSDGRSVPPRISASASAMERGSKRVWRDVPTGDGWPGFVGPRAVAACTLLTGELGDGVSSGRIKGAAPGGTLPPTTPTTPTTPATDTRPAPATAAAGAGGAAPARPGTWVAWTAAGWGPCAPRVP